jgi:hypothetical protein
MGIQHRGLLECADEIADEHLLCVLNPSREANFNEGAADQIAEAQEAAIEDGATNRPNLRVASTRGLRISEVIVDSRRLIASLEEFGI